MSVQAPHLRPASPWPHMSGPMGPVAAPAAPVAPALPAWVPASPVASPAAGAQRVAELEAMVASLTQQLNALVARLGGAAPALPGQQPVAPAPAAVAPVAPVQRPAWLNQLPAWLRPAGAAPGLPAAPAVPAAPVGPPAAPAAPPVPLAADGRPKPLVDIIANYRQEIMKACERSSGLELAVFSGALQGGKVFILPGYLMTHGIQMLSWAYLGREVTAEEKQRYQQWIWDQNGDSNKIQATHSRIMKDIEDRAVFQVLQQKMAAGQPVADLAQEAEAIRKKAADLLYYPK